jgi:predicted nucleotidyltransferase
MDRDQIIAKLRKYAPELKAAGVEHLFLHGSYARGTAIRGSSDVDVIAEFEPGRRLSLVDMVAIENRLTELLALPSQKRHNSARAGSSSANIHGLLDQCGITATYS